MPTITLNQDVFEKLVGKKLPIDKLKDRISMLGTDLEKIENNEIIVEVFPNRPDMLSEQGFARAFSSFIGTKTGLRKYEVKKSNQKVIVDKNVTMRPYTVCAIVKNLKFNDEKIREVMQIQEKLAKTHGRSRRKSAYGLYPLNNINFPIKYVAKDPNKVEFRPLGFEKTIIASKVEELHPKGKEYKEITKGWKEYPFFIDSKNNVMCMLPYTNSHDTGKVTEDTTEVFVECTGTDLENTQIALNILTTMLADMGGEIYSLEIEYHDKKLITPNLEPKKWKLNINFVNKLLGLELKDKEIKELLEKMGYGYEKGEILVPCYRADIMHQVDFIEDIAIAYGFENFVPEIPNVSTIGEENKFEIFKRQIAEILVGLNFLECETYHLSNIDNLNTKMCADTKIVKLENSLNLDYDVLRSWILPNLMQILKENKHYEYPQNIFNIGTAFKENKNTENGVEEFVKLALAICNHDSDFTKAKQILEYLMKCLNIKPEFVQEDHTSFIAGRCAKVKINNKDIAIIGEINPKVLSNWEIDMPCSAFELDLSELFSQMKQILDTQNN